MMHVQIPEENDEESAPKLILLFVMLNFDRFAVCFQTQLNPFENRDCTSSGEHTYQNLM